MKKKRNFISLDLKGQTGSKYANFLAKREIQERDIGISSSICRFDNFLKNSFEIKP